MEISREHKDEFVTEALELLSIAKAALIQAEMASLLDTTIKIILFQLPEIEDYLLKKGKDDNFNILKS